MQISKASRMNFRRSIALIALANLLGGFVGWAELHSRGASIDLANFDYIAFAFLLVTVLAEATLAVNCGPLTAPHRIGER